MGYSPEGHKELNMTEDNTFTPHISSWEYGKVEFVLLTFIERGT